MATARQHINDRGEVKWQPELDDGERAWNTRSAKEWAYYGDGFGMLGPVLYKSKARALRVAARREHKEAGWFSEVEDDS